MEDRFLLSNLLDYYGNLLTDKQKYIMNVYFNDDLSLSEISELTNTSRQAVYDIIKRCTKLLKDYDNILKLLEKDNELKFVKTTILEKIDTLQSALDGRTIIENIEDIKKYIIESL